MNKNMINCFRNKYYFLSNMYRCSIKINGVVYPSVENAFQAFKTLDDQERIKFATFDPYKAKKYGKKVKLRSDWEDIKVDIMYKIVKAKFEQNPKLLSMLLSTKDALLIEGNT